MRITFLQRCCWWIVCIVAVSTMSIADVSKGSCGALDNVVTSVRLVKLLYPQLKNEDLSIGFSGALAINKPVDKPIVTPIEAGIINIGIYPVERPVSGAIKRGTESHDGTGELGDFKLPLYLGFDFIDYSQHVVSCRPSFSQQAGGTTKMEKAAYDLLNSHPEWSDAGMVAAVNQKWPMRFGPGRKVELLESLPFRKLAEFYGPLRVTSAVFRVTSVNERDRGRLTTPGDNIAELVWYVMTKEVGTTRELQIRVDPFVGNILSVSEADERGIKSKSSATGK
jgi:hypothetical protein